MNRRRAIIEAAIVAALCLTWQSVAAAHGNEKHLRGTVTAVSEGSITVKTADGKTTEVSLDAKTAFTRGGTPAPKGEIKVGDRIVIHAGEKDGKLIAHTVQKGPAEAAKAAKAAHKH